MINRALISANRKEAIRTQRSQSYLASGHIAPRFATRLLHGSLVAALLLSGCSNSLDLRSQSQEAADDVTTQQPSMQSAQMNALSLTQAASADRYINNQDVMPITLTATKGQAKAIPSQSLVNEFAGRYSGQVPCALQASSCDSDMLDMTLTLLPDGSAVRTLVTQGKVNAMLDKEKAAWTVSANGQTILLILPSHEIWSFRKTGNHQLQFQPNASAMVEPVKALGQYSLVAANN